MTTPEQKYQAIKGKQPLEILYERERSCPDQVYLRQMQNREWREYTWGEVIGNARRIANFLRQRFSEGDRIAIHAKNCADWFIVDFAIMLAGMISVPLYPGQTRDSMRYVLDHSDSKLIFVGASDNNENIIGAATGIPTVAIQRCEIDCEQTLQEIVDTTEPFSGSPVYDLDALFTIMYTSGTTGNPKGVMHPWSTVTFAVPNMIRGFGYDEDDRFFSYLPLSHAAERIVVELHSLYSGTPVHFTESIDTFLEDLQRTRPTMFFSVPRLWAKFKEGIDAKISPPVQRTLLRIPLLNSWFKKKVAKGLGLDQARMLITGASPISEDLQKWYHRMGMMVADGYGMTENFIYGTINHMGDKPVPGTVGKPFWGNEVKISDEGEILFKSNALMSGYYREEEKTAEVLRNGYYHTGDAGFVDDKGLLHVTGRLSDTFKTSKGKFVQPPDLEKRFGEAALLGQVCVFGHGMDNPVMLATLSEIAQKMDKGAIAQELEQALDEVNAALPGYSRIRAIYISAYDWTPDNELVTPTLKIKRKTLEARFRPWVESTADEGEKVYFEPVGLTGDG